MNAILADTNVWLDYHLSFRAGHEDAFRLVDLAYQANIPLLEASHSLKDFWYLSWQACKTLNMTVEGISPEDASHEAKSVSWAATQHIAELATVVGSDASDAWLVLKMRAAHDDYEDNLVVAAALRAKPDLMVTSNQTLLAHCPVAAATPKDALTFLDLN